MIITERIMKLSGFDDKFIKLETTYGETVWGACMYNSRDYSEHEYGRREDALQIANFLFYRTDIKNVELSEQDGIPPYDMIQVENIKDGYSFYDDEVMFGDPRNIIRFLNCLDVYLDPSSGIELNERDKTIELFHRLADYTDDEAVREKALQLYEKWGL